MQKTQNSPSLFKYLAVIIYDLFLLFGLLLFITVIISFINNGNPPESNNISYKLFLLASIIFFYHYSWRKSGQTLGMKAWKVKLVTLDNKPITLGQSILRMTLGLANVVTIGLGYFWKYTNRSKLTLMDVLSKTKLITI